MSPYVSGTLADQAELFINGVLVFSVCWGERLHYKAALLLCCGSIYPAEKHLCRSTEDLGVCGSIRVPVSLIMCRKNVCGQPNRSMSTCEGMIYRGYRYVTQFLGESAWLCRKNPLTRGMEDAPTGGYVMHSKQSCMHGPCMRSLHTLRSSLLGRDRHPPHLCCPLVGLG